MKSLNRKTPSKNVEERAQNIVFLYIKSDHNLFQRYQRLKKKKKTVHNTYTFSKILDQMQGESHPRCTVFSYSCETSVLLLCPDRGSLPPDSQNHIYMRSKIEGCSLLMIICAISSWNILCIKGGNVTFMFEQCQLCGIWLQMSDISIWTENVQLTNINNLRTYFYAPRAVREKKTKKKHQHYFVLKIARPSLHSPLKITVLCSLMLYVEKQHDSYRPCVAAGLLRCHLANL